MNKKTRKLKRTNQKGGYIVSPTNPYFMAVAAVIGGLYAYGKTQSSNTEVSPTQDNGQSGGRKFMKTRRIKASKKKRTRRIKASKKKRYVN